MRTKTHFFWSELKMLISTALTKYHSLKGLTGWRSVTCFWTGETLGIVQQIPEDLAIFSFGDAKMSEGLHMSSIFHEAALEPLLHCKGKQRNSWFYQGLAACIKTIHHKPPRASDDPRKHRSWTHQPPNIRCCRLTSWIYFQRHRRNGITYRPSKQKLAVHLGIAVHGTQSSLVRVWNTWRPKWRLQL